MKKQLLALAVTSLAALPAVSMADTGPVVYGKVNVSLENTDHDDGVSSDDQWDLKSNASRIGVKGALDLDVEGLEAIYQAEFEIQVDDGDKGGDTFSQRNIFGGLKHDRLGTLMAGKFDTPLKKAQGGVDQFNDLGADIKNIMGGENRLSNLIQYSSPTIADSLTLHLAVQPGEGSEDADGDTQDGVSDAISSAIVFENDILFASLAYDQDTPADLIDNAGGGVDQADILRATLMGKFGGFEAGVLFQQAEDNTSGSDLEDQSYLVSGAYTLDRLKLKAQYGMTEGDATDNEATLMAVGADYKLGKSSKTFAYFAQIENEYVDADEDDTIFGIGFEHKFSL